MRSIIFVSQFTIKHVNPMSLSSSVPKLEQSSGVMWAISFGSAKTQKTGPRMCASSCTMWTSIEFGTPGCVTVEQHKAWKQMSENASANFIKGGGYGGS